MIGLKGIRPAADDEHEEFMRRIWLIYISIESRNYAEKKIFDGGFNCKIELNEQVGSDVYQHFMTKLI